MTNYLSSDALIMNILTTSDNEYLQQYHIDYANENILNENNNTIFISDIAEEYDYKAWGLYGTRALVEILIITDQSDYITSKKELKRAEYEIVKLLLNNNECKARNLRLENSNPEYDQKFNPKKRSLRVSVDETFILDQTPESIQDIAVEVEVKVKEE